MPRTASINGNRYVLAPLRADDVVPGARLKLIEGRRVYRVLAFDGDDVVMRNVRNPEDIQAFEADELADLFSLVLPGPVD